MKRYYGFVNNGVERRKIFTTDEKNNAIIPEIVEAESEKDAIAFFELPTFVLFENGKTEFSPSWGGKGRIEVEEI